MANETTPSLPPQRHSWLQGLFAALGLVSLVWLFSQKSHAPSDESARSQNPECQPDNPGQNRSHQHPGATNGSESNLPLTEPNKYGAYWYAQEFRKWGIFVIEFFGLFGLLYYAGITAKMWKEMQKQTKIQHDTLIASQRPWLKITHRIVTPFTFNSPAWQGPKSRSILGLTKRKMLLYCLERRYRW